MSAEHLNADLAAEEAARAVAELHFAMAVLLDRPASPDELACDHVDLAGVDTAVRQPSREVLEQVWKATAPPGQAVLIEAMALLSSEAFDHDGLDVAARIQDPDDSLTLTEVLDVLKDASQGWVLR